MPPGNFKKVAISIGLASVVAVAGSAALTFWREHTQIAASVAGVEDHESRDPTRPWLTPANGWPGIRNVCVDVRYEKNAEISGGYSRLLEVRSGDAWHPPPIGCAASGSLQRQATFVVPSNVEKLRVEFNYTAPSGLGRFLSPTMADAWLRKLVQPVSQTAYARLRTSSLRSLSLRWKTVSVEIALPASAQIR